MKRREFLHMTSGGALAAAGSLTRLASADGGRAIQAGGTMQEVSLEEMTVASLQQAFERGTLTVRQVVEQYLERIQAVDAGGAALNAVIEVNPDALSIADELDQERLTSGPRGPLHGVPIMLKDNIDTGDRMLTTAGSLALAHAPAPHDSFVAQRLRDAGAVILGKTNLSEWANFRSTRSSSGWSARGGQTKNPYALDRNPCGSSSGSGVAVSANLCMVAIGTETNGSIVCPSNATGVVGIKPTVGLVSRAGIIPISHTQDTAGPMARSVADAAAVLGALTGVDARDAATAPAAEHMRSDYSAHLDPNGLRGARIGVARNFFGFHERVDVVMEQALAAMRDGGATLVDPVEITTMSEMGEPAGEVLFYEFKATLNEYLANRGGDLPVRTLEELIAFNEANRDREMPYFGQERLLQSQEKGPLTDPEYQEALRTMLRLARDEGIDATMGAHNLDAIVAPTGGPAWVTDLVTGDRFLGSSSSPAARAGYPNITVPAGYVYGLPVGISFFGAAFSEPVLIRLAYAFEQATQARRVPELLATANL